MRLVGKDKELNKKWQPILRVWLKELPPMDMNFSVKLVPEEEIDPGTRGQFYIQEEIIVISLGSNDTQEIKHSFFHEIKHLLQKRNSTLAISIFASPEDAREDEVGACKFAVKYAPCTSEYISEVLAIYGIK